MGGFLMSPIEAQQIGQAATGGNKMGMDPVTGGLIGGGVSTVGGMVEGKKQRKFLADQAAQQRADIASAQGRLDAWNAGVPWDELTQMAMQPTTSTTSGTSSSVSNQNMLVSPEVTKQFAPTLDMLQNAYTNRVAEANFLPAGLLESEYGNIAQEEQAGNANLENIARQRGVDPNVLKLGSPVARQAAQARTAARRGAEDMRYQRQGQSLADLGSLASIWGKAQRTKGGTTTRGSQTSTTTGSPNIGNVLSVYQAQKPDIILPV